MNLIHSILCVLLVVAGNAAEPLHVRIDRLIDGGQVGALAGQSSDAEFVRRVYLDFTGRIPSSTAAREFIDNKAADKRAKIIDQLLGSHEYARHMAVSFDVMLMERRADKHVKTSEWRQYLFDSFRANKPWNKIVGEIFTSEGDKNTSTAKVPYAAAKFIMDRGMEVNLVTRDISRKFFGMDLQCAQCHDHPTIDDFYQRDYYGIYAFLSRSYIFQPDKETFLEYDIAKLVSTLSSPKRPVIGLISDVQMAGSFDPQTQRMSQPWVVYQQAQQLFEVRNLGTSLVQIADDISLLWIVQPKDLSNDTLYAIDQFVMNGGNAIIFVDPVADVDPVAMEGMPQGMPPMGQGSDLPELFDAWGITFSTEEVVADAELALQISGMDRRPVRHYGYVGVTGEHMSADNIVTADLSVVHVATGGAVGGVENGPLTVEPLLSSSSNAQTMPATRFSFVPDPAALQDGFAPQGDPFTLAARFNGSLSSAFPDGPPPTNISLADGDDTAVRNYADHRTHSSDPVNLIVVGDVDMLADHLWVQVQNLFGQQLTNAFASNGAFVVNALENLSGSSDLIGVRSRASFTRPFTKVESLRVDAEARFRTTEERLQRELDETERRLVELQSAREDSGNILLTPAQQGEIDRFVDQRGVIRQELRAVQRGLDEDIERLGTIVKVINIGLVPTLLTGFVLIAVWRRNRRLHE